VYFFIASNPTLLQLVFYYLTLISFFLAFIFSWLLIPQIRDIAFQKKLFDEPNHRKLHTFAIPRLGGISFFPVILFTLLFCLSIAYQLEFDLLGKNSSVILPEFLMLTCGTVILYLMGIQDDLVGVRYHAKFILQSVVALFIPLSGLWINNLHGLLGIYDLSPWIGIPLTLFLIVFIINAINLIDGIDGLASGLCSIAFITLGVFFLIAKAWIFAMLAFISFGVLLSFFYYNVFGQPGKRKIFMGDTGSLTLGYILAFLIIRFSAVNPEVLPVAKGAIAIAFSLLLVPSLDVCRVILVRVRERKHLFTADQNHIHHKFLLMKFSQREALVRILIMAVLFCIFNILLVQYINVTFIFLIDVAVWIGLHLWFNSIMAKRNAVVLQQDTDLVESMHTFSEKY